MRTEAEIKEARDLVKRAQAQIPVAMDRGMSWAEAQSLHLMQQTAMDVLDWFTGANNRFEEAIIKPGREHDRAVRQ